MTKWDFGAIGLLFVCRTNARVSETLTSVSSNSIEDVTRLGMTSNDQILSGQKLYRQGKIGDFGKTNVLNTFFMWNTL